MPALLRLRSAGRRRSRAAFAALAALAALGAVLATFVAAAPAGAAPGDPLALSGPADGARAGVVLSGGNVDAERFASLVAPRA